MNLNEILGMVMLCSMIAVIFIGFPISFTLLFLALMSEASARLAHKTSISPTCRSGAP